MFSSGAFKAFSNDLTVNVTTMNAQAAQAAMARVAEAAKARVLAGAPKPSGYRQIVDGTLGAPLTAVRPDGVIVFTWQYLGEAVWRVYDLMFQSSPIVSGQYARGIQVLADGQRVSATEVPPDAKQVHIVATVDYARRLEVGRRKDGSPFVLQVPLHNVEKTMSIARRLYGDLAKISFTYVDLSDSYTIRRASGHRRSGRRIITQVRYPAILIEPRTA